ncbi:MAG: biotin transporter BioY [Ruminococcus sp.]|jgi:biotin transport system substrate-specific component
MKHEKISVQDMMKIALMTAALAVMSIIQIPSPTGVPLTLQTFAAALCGYLLGTKKGCMTMILYLLAGLAGLPVFSGMKGGIGVLGGPTGGFLLGFMGLVFMCGMSSGRRTAKISIFYGFLGVCICHICGMLWFSLLMNQAIGTSFILVSLPYIPKDLVSAAGAFFAADALKKGLHRAGIYQEI